MEECKIQRDAELRTFTARLKKFESARLAQKFSAEEDLERVVGQFGAEISTYENRVADLQERPCKNPKRIGKIWSGNSPP